MAKKKKFTGCYFIKFKLKMFDDGNKSLVPTDVDITDLSK